MTEGEDYCKQWREDYADLKRRDAVGKDQATSLIT